MALPPGNIPAIQWVPGSFWTGAENLALNGIRSPGRSPGIHSLYRLHCLAPPPPKAMLYLFKIFFSFPVGMVSLTLASWGVLIQMQCLRSVCIRKTTATLIAAGDSVCLRSDILPVHQVSNECKQRKFYPIPVSSGELPLFVPCVRQRRRNLVSVQCRQYSDTIHDDPAGSLTMPQNGILSQTGKKSRIAIGRAARLWDQDDEICKQWTGNCTACNGCLLTSSNVGRRMTCIVSHLPKSGQRTSACECNEHSCSQVHVGLIALEQRAPPPCSDPLYVPGIFSRQ